MIYKTPDFTKCFHMTFYHRKLLFLGELLPQANVTCVSSHDRILLFGQYVLSFLVHYYSAVPIHIGKGALECHLPIKFSENKRFRKIRKKKKNNNNCSSGIHL